MKKSWLSGVSALAASALLLLAGCNNISGGEIAGGSFKANGSESDATTVTATIYGIESGAELTKQVSNRTVLPTPQAIDTTGGLTYILEGTSTNGGVISAKKIAVSSGAAAGQGKVTIEFPDSSVWELTLTAYQNSADATDAGHVQEKEYTDTSVSPAATKYAYNPVLTATTNVDLQAASPDIVFNMNVKGLETPGSVEISSTAGFTYTGNSVAITKYEISLRNIITGEIIQTTAPAAATTGKVSVATETGTTHFTADDTSLANVAPGEYVLGVTFYNTYNGTDYQVGFYSDLVVVAPGQTTTFTDIITGIEEKPAAPLDFTADLVANSELNGTYLVQLNWVDNAKNESNYEVDLYEVTDAAKATNLTATTIKEAANATKLATLGFASLYSAEDAAANQIVDFKDGSLYYGAGSLFAGSQSATLKLETGKLYEVVIRAVKGASDASDDVLRDASSTATVGYAAGTNHINRVRLTYITAPYTITVGSDVGQQYVTYDTYKGADIALLTTDDFSLTYKGEAVSADNFKRWIDAQDGKSTKTATDYKNITVLAEITLDVEAVLNTYTYDATTLDESFVTVKRYTAAADTTGSAVTITGKKASVNATENERISVEVNSTVAANYTGYLIALDGYVYTETKDCTLYLSRLSNGTHNILVAGKKADASGNETFYSYSFTLTVER
ncbi:MAG: hypothetical protein K6G80_05340 [Treponema sp.]|nr:hypothetical protein [Treponema sp.]